MCRALTPIKFGKLFCNLEKTLLPFLRVKPPKLVLLLSPVNETHFLNKPNFVKVSLTSYAMVTDFSFLLVLTLRNLD